MQQRRIYVGSLGFGFRIYMGLGLISLGGKVMMEVEIMPMTITLP